MPSTLTITHEQLDSLGASLGRLEAQLDDDQKHALLAVFALAGEALDARIERQTEVEGFAAGNLSVGVSLELGGNALGPGFDATVGAAAKGKGKGKGGGSQQYMVVKLVDVMVSSY